MERSSPTERLASLEQRLGDHEARCEERLREIKATVASTLQAIEGLKSRAWGVVAALLAWALAQLWTNNAHHFERLDRDLPVATKSLVAGPSHFETRFRVPSARRRDDNLKTGTL